MEVKLFNRRHHFALNGLNVSRRLEYSLLMRYLQLRGTESVLDVACGDGFWTAKVATRARSVMGFDFNHERLLQARRTLAGYPGGLVGSDAHFLPFGEGVFEAAIGLCVLEHFQDDAAALSELRRVLKPGGKLALTVDSFSVPGTDPLQKARHAEQFHVHHWYKKNDLDLLLQRTGFEVLQISYLLRSPIAVIAYRQALKARRLSYFLFPLSYPLSLLGERWSKIDAYGYKLAVCARAV